jgi:hypothetical protein
VVVERHNFLQENSSSPCAGAFLRWALHRLQYHFATTQRGSPPKTELHALPNSTRWPKPEPLGAGRPNSWVEFMEWVESVLDDDKIEESLVAQATQRRRGRHM